MKNFIQKYFYQSIVLGLLIVVSIVLLLGYLVTNVFNVTPGYIGANKQVLMTSGDSSITLDEGIFIAKDMQAYYEEYYVSQGQTVNWKVVNDNGDTYEQVILNDTLQLLKEVFLFSEYAKANGYELSENELKNIKSDVSAYLSDSPAALILATGANSDLLNRFYTRTAYYNKVCDEIYNNADLTVDEEDVRQCLVAIATISPDDFDSPKQTADKILERVNNGEVLAGVADKYGATVTKTNIGSGSLEGNELEKLCMSLKDSECKLIEIKGTYYVVYCYLACDEDKTDAAKEQKISDLKEKAKLDYYNELIKTMPIELDESAWETINFNTAIYTKDNIGDTILTE